jgi:hypothetical protein
MTGEIEAEREQIREELVRKRMRSNSRLLSVSMLSPIPIFWMI